MDIFGISDNHDIFGNPPHNSFGGTDDANVFGEEPQDAWGNPGQDTSEPQDATDNGSA
jgi:hypothetical protein